MLFFYSVISSFNSEYSTLLGQDDEKDDKTGEGQGEEKDAEGEKAANTFNSKWGWIYSVKEVADMVHAGWNEVFEMEIREFFNILSFCHDYNLEMKRQQDKMIQKYKHK